MKSIIISLILIFLLPVTLSFASNVKELEGERTLSKIQMNSSYMRVGLILDNGYSQNAINVLGDLYGIDVDYMSLLSRYINVEFRYFSFESESSAYKALLADNIDAVVTSSSLFSEDTNLVKSDSIYKSNLASWFLNPESNQSDKGRNKVGCIITSPFCNRIKNNSQVVYVDNTIKGMRMVLEGEIDGFIDSYAFIAEYLDNYDIKQGELTILDKDATLSTYLVTEQGNRNLISLVNEGIQRFKQDGSDLTGTKNLYHQHDQKISRLISSMNHRKVFRYSIDDNLYPLFYRDGQGNLAGYIYDFINLLQARSGLIFEYVSDEGKSISEMIEKGDIDFVPIVKPFDDLNENIVSSKPYINVSYVKVELRDKKGNRANNEKMGVLVRNNIFSFRRGKEKFGNDVRIYSDAKEMLSDLDQGVINTVVMTSQIAKSFLIRNEDDKYKIDSNVDYLNKIGQVALGVSANNPLLLNALNSVIDVIDNNEILSLFNSYKKFDLVYGYEKSFINSIALVIIVLVLSVAIITVLVLRNLKLQVNLRKLSEGRVKQQLLWLQEVINELPDMIVIRDRNMNIVLTNEEYKRNSSLFSSLAYGSKSETKALLTDEQDVYSIMIDSLVIRDTIKLEQPHNRIQYLNLMHKSIVNPVTKENFILSSFQDVTVLKQQEIDLIEANKKAETAMNARSQFLANMSHELRTPIAGMLGLLELLKQKISSKEALYLVDNIHASSSNLQLLVNDVLDFSKIEANQFSLDVSSTEIYTVIGSLLRCHQAAAKEKKLAFEVEWTPFNIEFMDIDTLRFSQVINNLMSNAIKFTDKGSIRVSIAVENDYLHIEIKDSGIGIEADKLSSIFKPFEQADGSIARSYGGTGLGLSIVNSLVSLLQGDLEIKSTVNKGTTVYLRFPVVAAIPFKKLPLKCSVRYLGDNKTLNYWLNTWGGDPSVAENAIQQETADAVSSKVAISHCDEEIINVTHCEDDEHKQLLQMSESCFYPDLLLNTLRQKEVSAAENTLTFDENRSIRVLVAEDHAINRVLIEQQLERLGVQYKIVADGEQAYQELERSASHYHVLLTDYHMPKLDGLSLAHKVREQLPEFNDKKIIAMTAEVSNRINLETEEGGFEQILYKPYTLQDLAEVLLENVPSKAKKEVDFLSLFSDIFCQTMSADMEVLAASIDDYDDAFVKKVVHRIKGGAISVGLTSISDEATEIESLIDQDVNREKVIKQVSVLMDAISKEIKALNR
ncbi:ATP-binding protein [Vibrio sp. 99-8-1]|uniref:ATP-binding protein n=1 Tax=Vibrio sp. 99-8-1 TaxID=2607602 RepID=UPI0014937439|nr:ATP-binding protein [Vibrio sp. 99-8-1]NOI67116.1 transporter substrate-binding domain-containing protein [Vibrio sp. 99-8-1]